MKQRAYSSIVLCYGLVGPAMVTLLAAAGLYLCSFVSGHYINPFSWYIVGFVIYASTLPLFFYGIYLTISIKYKITFRRNTACGIVFVVTATFALLSLLSLFGTWWISTSVWLAIETVATCLLLQKFVTKDLHLNITSKGT